MKERSIFEDVVSEYVIHQPWFVRRKDTILMVVGMLLQVANILTAYTAQAPAWVTIALATAIGIGQAIITASTKGAVTPSMGERLARVAERLEPTTPKHSRDVIDTIRDETSM